MSDDVTIPRETARKAGEDIRLAILTTDDTDLADRLDRLADLLDPPQPSLRDEVLLAIDPTNGGGWEGEADAVLAVVRKRIEALPKDHGGRDTWWVNYHDVLALLGGEGT